MIVVTLPLSSTVPIWIALIQDFTDTLSTKILLVNAFTSRVEQYFNTVIVFD